MKVGIIAPIKFLDKYCITNIQYCLPHLLCKNKEYREFYTNRQREGNTIILDCRNPTWKREPASPNEVGLSLKLINPTIIVAPSQMFNSLLSRDLYREFLTKFPSLSYKTVRCLEGTSKEDAKEYFKEPIAIPSHMYNYVLGKAWGPQTIFVENHLNLEELDRREGILVTSLPVRLGLRGRLLSNYLPSPPSLTFYEEENKYPEITGKNVEETIEYYKA